MQAYAILFVIFLFFVISKIQYFPLFAHKKSAPKDAFNC